MYGKSSVRSGALFYLYLSTVLAEFPDSEVNFLNNQIIPSLPYNAQLK